MDLEVQYTQFLGLFGTPTDSLCCSLLTLRTGLYLVAGFDLVLGVLSVTEGLLTLWFYTSFSFVEGATTVAEDVLAAAAIPFALFALRDMVNSAADYVRRYRSFKVFELCAVCVVSLVVFPVLCPVDALVCDWWSLLLAWVLRTGFNLYCAYVVWSTEKRMSNNELILVMYGPEVAKIVKEQTPQLSGNSSR